MDREPFLDLDRVSAAYEAHFVELCRFATTRMRDAAAADDIVQEAYLRLAIEARAGRFPRQPRAWLYRVAMNLIVSGARRGATARQALGRAPDERVDHETPESRFMASEGARTVESAMATLSPRGRTGLVMSSMGYTGREIAATLGCSHLASRALMHRARTSARRALALAEAA